MKTAPSKRTLLGLDAVNFLMADVHTGVGPFVAIYLAASLHWNPRDIGIALSAAGIAGLVAQTPVGAFVDGLRYKREMLAVGTALWGIGALTIVFFRFSARSRWSRFFLYAVRRLISNVPAAASLATLATTARAAGCSNCSRTDRF